MSYSVVRNAAGFAQLIIFAELPQSFKDHPGLEDAVYVLTVQDNESEKSILIVDSDF